MKDTWSPVSYRKSKYKYGHPALVRHHVVPCEHGWPAKMEFIQGLLPTKVKVVNINSKIRALAFLPDRIVSGEESTVQLRNTEDLMGESIKSDTGALAVVASRDGRWFVTGTIDGFAIWNKKARVVHHPMGAVRTIDISSDSKWVVTGSDDRTADVWDISTGERRPGLGPLRHEYNVISVKFCPCGKRIATATLFGSVRIFATNSAQKLFTIPISVNVSPTLTIPNVTFAWSALRPQVFAVSQGQIKCLNADDGSIVFQWALRGIRHPSSVVLSPNNKIIAYTLNDSVVLGDPSSRKQIGDPLKHDGDVTCIAFSPESDVLVAGADTKLSVWYLRKLDIDASYFVDTKVEAPKSCVNHDQDTMKKPLPTTFSLPLMSIINAAVKPWLHSFLEYTEKVLSEEIERCKSAPDHNNFANRALIRGRLCNGGAALEDAIESLRILESPIGWIAKAIGFIHKKDYVSARETIPHVLMFRNFDEYKALLEAIQSILRCLSGEYDTEKSRITRLGGDQKLLLLVQANMHLFKENFDDAATSFNKTQMPAIFPHEESREMWTIAFIFGWKFSGLAIQIQQRKCQFLLDAENSEAAVLFVQVRNTYAREIAMHVELSDWSLQFRRDCLEKLEARGDRALGEKDYAEAIKQYTAIEPLILGDLDARFKLLLKRSQAHAEIVPSNWMKALQDAEEAIKLNPLSPWGYDRKHIVLYDQHHFREAAEALDEMIRALSDSPDDKSKGNVLRHPIIFTFSEKVIWAELRQRGVKPRETRKIVVNVVDETLAQPRPLILINTESGRMCDKDKQREAFKAHPQYKKLVLSPASEVAPDGNWKDAVQQYFHYSTLSHTWEARGEPEYHDVEYISVEMLPESFPNEKLKMLCRTTRKHGLLWAWSDTCCIRKADKEVLNLSLRSMYQWYSGSSLTIVHLKGVLEQLELDLDKLLAMLKEILDKLLQGFVECRWNQRAWTLQEYFASRIIHFYTEDWKPYLPIPDVHSPDATIINHKKLPAIQRGMELATGLDADHLAALKPGSNDARQKLSLASKRTATRREDIAYSMLGIFKVTIEAVYGDDEVPRALGRLLEALLTQSADVSILAWTGMPSEYNTCLPSEITVYQAPESIHIPEPIKQDQIEATLKDMRQSMSDEDVKSAITLHDRLLDAPPPELLHGRLKLSCILFPILSVTQSSSFRGYTANVELLGTIEIKTGEDPPSARNMFLVHPWFKSLLDPGIPLSEPVRRDNALKLLAALRQPFGALLLAWTTRDYNRIATDALIRVHIPKDVSTRKLLDKVHVLRIR